MTLVNSSAQRWVHCSPQGVGHAEGKIPALTAIMTTSMDFASLSEAWVSGCRFWAPSLSLGSSLILSVGRQSQDRKDNQSLPSSLPSLIPAPVGRRGEAEGERSRAWGSVPTLLAVPFWVPGRKWIKGLAGKCLARLIMSAAQRCQGLQALTAMGWGGTRQRWSQVRERGRGRSGGEKSIRFSGGSLLATNFGFPRWACVQEGWAMYKAHGR